MKRTYLMLFFLAFSVVLFAQEKTVSGNVTDEEGAPLPGASIVIQGTTTGAQTDFDGNYAIKATEGQVLVFSYVGFSTQNITVGAASTINVVLQEDTSVLDEVVVVGYGTQNKESLSGSVATIESEKLIKQPVFQTSQALQGLSPGLTAIQSSGRPGDDGATLRIRGINSINASSSPLVIIDGIEGSLNGIDSGDIESISVLKDAGAAAIYGNRGANGVIVITTKRAKAGRARVTYNSYVGFQDPTNQPDPVDAVTYLEATGDDALLQQYLDNPGDTDNFPDTDWIDLLFSESGFIQYHSVGVSGGSESVRTNATFSYQDQDGNIPGFGFERFQGRVNTDFKVSDKIQISADINFRRSDIESSPAGTGVQAAYRQPAIFQAIYSDGRFALPSTGGNPVAGTRASGSNTTQANYFRGLLRAVYKPIPELELSAVYSPEHAESYNSNFRVQYPVYESFDGPEILISSGTNNQTQLNQSNNRAFTDNFYATARYDKHFGKHHITALGGYEFIKSVSTSFGASRFEFVIQDFEVLDNGNAENDANEGSATQNGLESVFGRFNYAFNNKYLLEFNIRRDGSSRFNEANRWGTFPSFSAAWRITEEPFMQNQKLFSNLKLRGSWGQLGNQILLDNDGNIIDFPYSSLIAIGSSHFANGGIAQGAAQQVLGNSNITWETAEKTNIGLEFGLLNGQLTGSVEYYDNKTNDLLGTQQIPSTVGLGNPIANVFSMKNTGIDVELNWNGKIGENFRFNLGGNFATVNNEVTDLNGEEFLISGNSILEVGESAGSIFGFESEGIFQTQEEIDNSATQFAPYEPGDIKFKDQNNDGVIDNDDRVIIGNSFPGVTYSINGGFDFKGFDFSVNAIGVSDREVYLQRNLVQPLFNAGNIFEYHLTESWTPENPNARFPILKPYSGASNNSRTNSTYVFDASYLRIRNITLGYSLPSKVLENNFIGSLRFYVSGQNLITLNKDLPDGIDPLIPNNSQGGIYPIVKVYTFGINATF
ncbi:MAG: SusC/RagA family TonB-linked outer membrane protein [Allomuricauda sp.]